ncbi:MAG: Uncharacterised protein [SAR116 cluster bacterium MED-G04]|nr:MAG: Uncharacterised protein [SAR116 cluster bacterium MED-G04]
MNIASYFRGYADKRMLRIFLIGMISGFPWVLIGSALSLWLKETGLDRSTVGFAGLIFGVYVINFLWAPLIDRLPVPYLSNRIGARKAWIVLCQLVIIACLFGWSMLNPSANLALVVGIGLVIAIASATQDITIDAFRIEQVNTDENEAMAAGAAMAVIGWWTGFKLGGLLMLSIADKLEKAGFANYWPLSFIAVAGLVVLMLLALLMIPEPRRAAIPQEGSNLTLASMIIWIKETAVEPLGDFFRRNGLKLALALLGFIFLFKIGEAFMGRMSIIFYREIGFSKTDIGLYSKGLGWVVTVVFTLIGGWFSMRSGTVRALFLAGIVMASTNILFSVLAWTGKSEWLFAVAVVLDDLAAAYATVAFVAFISLLVNRRYTATQYALLASIGTAGRTIMASSSGVLVNWLDGDWGGFFIITALMVIPSLVLLWWIAPKIISATVRAGQSA